MAYFAYYMHDKPQPTVVKGMFPYQLVGNVAVVLAGELLANRALHETRQRREHVDGRVNLTVVQLAINEDLSLRNVPSKVGNWVRDVYKGSFRPSTPQWK
jgi:hypothetical protein